MTKEAFIQAAGQLGTQITEGQMKQFDCYQRLLEEWNQKMNLTSITDYEEVLLKHFLDSIACSQALTQLYKQDQKACPMQQAKVIDVGTGAGFPGLPLRIIYPQMQLVLLDSLNKRLKFLEEVCNQTEIAGVKLVHGRAEDVAQEKDYREKFDYSVSRAVANLSTLVEYCLPFVRVGGYFMAYKSGAITEELQQAEKAVRLLGGKVELVSPLQLPGSDISRTFVLIKKCRPTPKKFPRKAGLPSKEPIC